MGRLDPDMGNAQVVAPGSAQDPFSGPSASNAAPASAPAGPAAAPAGQPVEGTPNPAPTAPAPAPAATAPPAAPPAPPPAQTPTEPGPTPVTETVDPPATPSPAPAQPLSVEDVERARQTAVEETDAKWRARQGGLDRQNVAIQRELEAARAATEEQKQVTRQVMLSREGLTDEEKARLQTTWDLDDEKQRVREFSESTLDMHADVEIAYLLLDYRDIPGVNAEALEGIAQEDREGFCKDQKIAFLESGGQPAATNGAAQPAPAVPAATPPPAAPAGASAPSDIGGGGTPPAPVTKNENPGADAMAENIGGSGWRDVTFSSRSGRR